ncbi:MAG: hypothetical protein DDT41_01740 [candidate division WS2 bacterium]|nr:hypothetical protein [Candidatus Psychracetigena formicireducens]
MLKKKIILTIIIIILVAGGLVYATLMFQRGDFFPKDITIEEPGELSKVGIEGTTGEIGGVKYEIVRAGRIADPIAKIMVYEVVTEKMDEERVWVMAEKIIGDITREDADIDRISLLFFTDKNLIETQPYNIAQVIWQPEAGGITPEIAEKNLRDNYIIFVLMAEPTPPAI